MASAFTRLEKDGEIRFTDGTTRSLKVPSVQACRERLLKLLEEAGGDRAHPCIKAFWLQRSKEIGDLDQMKAAWARELFVRLEEIWTEYTTPPGETKQVDIFSGVSEGYE